MKRTRKGFTLIELVVVTLIMGILASMSMPYYYKTIESSKATDAMTLGQLLAASYRMYMLDNPGTLSGSITNSCNGLSCALASGACRVVACKYVAEQDWNNASYTFNLSGGCGGIVCVDRIDTGSPYDSWGYSFNNSGGCEALSGAPSCPKF